MAGDGGRVLAEGSRRTESRGAFLLSALACRCVRVGGVNVLHRGDLADPEEPDEVEWVAGELSLVEDPVDAYTLSA